MQKSKFLLLSLLILSTGCYSLNNSISSGKPYNEQINWPDGYEPVEAEFYIHNKIAIEASPEVVWQILTKAEAWPEWYSGMSNVEVVGAEGGIITANADLRFNTMKRDFEARVVEFQPYERLTWETINPKMTAIHTWLIIPNETGCLVITDESQNGKLARLQKVFLPNKLRKLHDVWLEELKNKAENQEYSN